MNTITPNSSLDLHAKVLDDGVRQNVARQRRGQLARARLVRRVVQSDLEILALPNVLYPLVAQKLDRVLYGLALRVEHARLQCDVDFCFHGFSVISSKFKVQGSKFRVQALA